MSIVGTTMNNKMIPYIPTLKERFKVLTYCVMLISHLTCCLHIHYKLSTYYTTDLSNAQHKSCGCLE